MKKILIVEDNAIQRRILGELIGEDYEVHQACNGDEGRAIAMELNPDYILTDHSMGRGYKTGLEMITDIYDSGKNIPAIVMSGYLSESEENNYLSLGVEVFDKPVDIKSLLATLESRLKPRPDAAIKQDPSSN